MYLWYPFIVVFISLSLSRLPRELYLRLGTCSCSPPMSHLESRGHLCVSLRAKQNCQKQNHSGKEGGEMEKWQVKDGDEHRHSGTQQDCRDWFTHGVFAGTIAKRNQNIPHGSVDEAKTQRWGLLRSSASPSTLQAKEVLQSLFVVNVPGVDRHWLTAFGSGGLLYFFLRLAECLGWFPFLSLCFSDVSSSNIHFFKQWSGWKLLCRLEEETNTVHLHVLPTWWWHKAGFPLNIQYLHWGVLLVKRTQSYWLWILLA